MESKLKVFSATISSEKVIRPLPKRKPTPLQRTNIGTFFASRTILERQVTCYWEPEMNHYSSQDVPQGLVCPPSSPKSYLYRTLFGDTEEKGIFLPHHPPPLPEQIETKPILSKPILPARPQSPYIRSAWEKAAKNGYTTLEDATETELEELIDSAADSIAATMNISPSPDMFGRLHEGTGLDSDDEVTAGTVDSSPPLSDEDWTTGDAPRFK